MTTEKRSLIALAITQSAKNESTERERLGQLLVLFFFSGDGEGRVCLIVAVMVVRILLVLCCLYSYQLCIVMFMNTSNIYLWVYIKKVSTER
jgi:hypothetical protein